MLIEKEWLQFGHQFATRNYLHNDSFWENFYSPIFIQWLDCVYQLLVKNHGKFEFKSCLLSFIAHHVYSGKYGTFLTNCEKEREKYRKCTVSIFDEIMQKKEIFVDEFYM